MSADGSFGFSSSPSPEELAKFELDDLGNGMRFVRCVGGRVDADGSIDLHGATLLYIREIGWIGWNGRYWDLKLGARLAERHAHKVARGLVAQRPWLNEMHTNSKEVASFIVQSGNVGSLKAMRTVAEGYLQVELEDFDKDPLAFNVQNGTLKFKREPGDGLKISFSEHDPADRITRMAHVDYQPKAKAPVWESTLAAWHEVAEVRDFLRRAAGYIATGYTHEQVFIILQGRGRDGKSTFVGVMRELFGDYGGVADVKSFLDIGQRGASDASPDMARLAGDLRLVSVAEPPRGAKLAEGMIKAFTGGAPITARRLRQDIFEFMPKPKVIMECNSRPVIKGDDEGIWRRIRLIMFRNQVAKDKVDKTLPEKLRAEYPGILNWILQGVGDWLAQGLSEPDFITAAMEDYRKGSSPFGEWFMDRLELDETSKIRASLLYGDYKDWCEANSIEKPMSTTAFGNALADRQIIRCGKDGAGNVLRKGAKIRPKFDPDDVVAPIDAQRAGGPMGDVDDDPFLDR